MNDIAKDLKQIKKALDLGKNYGAGPSTLTKQLKGKNIDYAIIDDLQNIFAVYGVDLKRIVKINSLENTKMKDLLYDDTNTTNK